MMLRDDLIAARALIDTPEKWRKDASDLSSTCCCAVLAANRAMRHRRGDVLPLWRALAKSLPETWRLDRYHEQPGILVGDYNDAPATTHADIMALFDRAIQAATPEPENKS